MRKSTGVYALVLILLTIGIAFAYVYSRSPLFAVVRITFDVYVNAYSEGDYATSTFHSLTINFTRTQLHAETNQTTPVESYPGHLERSLRMSLNLTLTSSTNQVTMPTHNLTFTSPGHYAVVFSSLLRNVPTGRYVVTLAFTDYFREGKLGWASRSYYYDLEDYMVAMTFGVADVHQP